jgi:hypothetical protein
MFHQWVSVVQPSAQITNSNDMKLYQTTDPATGYLVNNTG